MTKKHVHIVGLGWLGLPLAKALQNSLFEISGSVTSTLKQQRLASYFDVDLFQLNAQESFVNTRCSDAYLVLNIPPGRSNTNYDLYASYMIQLIDSAFASGLKYLCFVSTTSVFGGHANTISHKTELAPVTHSAIAHVKIEKHLRTHYPSQHSVVRPSGLVGPSVHSLTNGESIARIETSTTPYRHPVFSLCQKQNIPNGHHPVNLVHLDDLITVISKLLEGDIVGTFNVSALDHPSKAEYYTWCAKQLNLPLPGFSASNAELKLTETKKRQDGKIIDAYQTFTFLNVRPIHKSIFSMLPKS